MPRKLLAISLSVIVAAGVWVVAAGLPVAARFWLVFLLAVLPFVLVAQATLLDSVDDLEPASVYLSSAISLWILGGGTAVVLLASGIGANQIGLRPLPVITTSAWAAGATAVCLMVLAVANLMGVRESPVLRRIVPRTTRQKLFFVGLSVNAGFFEELVFRGFLIDTLASATGMLVVAVLLSSVVFGLLHAYQHVAGAIRAAVLGTLLAVPLLVTGSLVPSMIAHAAVDVIAGIWLRDRLLT